MKDSISLSETKELVPENADPSYPAFEQFVDRAREARLIWKGYHRLREVSDSQVCV